MERLGAGGSTPHRGFVGTQLEDSSDNTCPTCGESFETKKGVSLHHVHTHGESIAGVELECDICGESFRVSGGHAERRRTCSRECGNKLKRRKAQETQPYELDADDVELVESGICPICRKQLDDAHAVKSHTFQVHQKSIARKRYTCENCGEEYTLVDWRKNSQHGTKYCSYSCAGEGLKVEGENHPMYGRTGSNSPNWKGGRNMMEAVRGCLGPRPWPEISAIYRWKVGECELCGDGDLDLETHHIVPIYAGGTNLEYNLMALCSVCHKKAEYYTDEYFEPVYLDSHRIGF